MWLCIKDNFLDYVMVSRLTFRGKRYDDPNNFLDYVMVSRLTFRGKRYDDPNGDAECNVAQLLQWQLRLYKKDEPIDV